MGNDLSSKRDEAIIKILSIKDYTKAEINERLSKELQYKGKFWDIQLSKKLNRLIYYEKIELSKEKSRYPKYTTKKNPNSIAQADGSLFNLNMGETLLRNWELVFSEISKSRKFKMNYDQEYTRNLIEFLGMYIFSMLIRSYDVPLVLKGKQLKQSRVKNENEQKDKQYKELRNNWLVNALSLEEGVFKTSRMFDGLIHEFAKLDSNGNYNKKTKPTKESEIKAMWKISSSFEQIYPTTTKNISRVMDKSDEVLNSLKNKSNNDPKLSDDLIDFLTQNSKK